MVSGKEKARKKIGSAIAKHKQIQRIRKSKEERIERSARAAQRESKHVDLLTRSTQEAQVRAAPASESLFETTRGREKTSFRKCKRAVYALHCCSVHIEHIEHSFSTKVCSRCLQEDGASLGKGAGLSAGQMNMDAFLDGGFEKAMMEAEDNAESGDGAAHEEEDGGMEEDSESEAAVRGKKASKAEDGVHRRESSSR
eukprot:4790716-Pleurochrysis_carterae.AAC.5